MPQHRLRISSESRLLLITIVTAAAALLLLARLRFPEPPPPAAVTIAPLEKLAARAAYDELAATIGRLEHTIAPSLIVLRMTRRSPVVPLRIADLLAGTAEPATVQHVPALRLDETTAVAWFTGDVQIDGIEGASGRSGVASIAAIDAIRHLARIRVPSGALRQLTAKPLSELGTPAYVVAIEGTNAGITVRPVFIGHADRFGSDRWGRPLLPLGGVPVTAGALMFALDGDFLGVTVTENGALAIASASDVLDTAQRLAVAPEAVPVSIGIAVQTLTGALAGATGAAAGVVVSQVDEAGPAIGILQAGDVITDINGQPVTSPEPFLLSVAAHHPGDAIRLGVVTARVRRDVTVMAATVRPVTRPDPARDEIALETVRGEGARVRSAPGSSVFATAGIEPGDVITRAAEIDHPTARQVQHLIAVRDESPVLLAVLRDGRQRVVAIPRRSPEPRR